MVLCCCLFVVLRVVWVVLALFVCVVCVAELSEYVLLLFMGVCGCVYTWALAAVRMNNSAAATINTFFIVLSFWFVHLLTERPLRAAFQRRRLKTLCQCRLLKNVIRTGARLLVWRTMF